MKTISYDAKQKLHGGYGMQEDARWKRSGSNLMQQIEDQWRVQFETWARIHLPIEHITFERLESTYNGQYACLEMEFGWQAWRAAKRSL